jgi:hypothetical protein
MNQTLPYYEWIIVNDGSTNEAEAQRLDELAATDKRIRVLHKKNGGPAEARNTGIDAALSDIIVPLDSDDLILPTFLEYMYWALLKNPGATWAYCGLVGFGDSQYLWSVAFLSEIERSENVLIGCSAIRKAALLDVGGYYVCGKHYNEDWHLWLKLLAAGKQPMQLKDYFGFWYRLSDTGEMSVTKKDPELRARNEAAIAEIAQNVPDGIAAIHGMGERRSEHPLPKTSEWDRKIKYTHEKTKVLLLLPCMTEQDAGTFILDIITRMESEKYEFSVITTQPHSWDASMKQWFERYATDIFDLAHFLCVDDYAEFIHYFIKSRGTDVIFLSDSDYGHYLLPWLRLMFPYVTIITKTTAGA